MYTRAYNSTDVTDITQLKQNGVVLDGFGYLIASVLIAMFAVFNYILINRENADYSVLKWLTMEPLSVTWGVLGMCFLLYLYLTSGGYTLDRFLTICAVMVVGGLMIWSYVSDSDEFDTITPAKIPKWDSIGHIVPVMAVIGYTYFLFLGGSVRLDRMDFFSVPSFMIMTSIYLMAYASMTVCSFLIDFARANDKYTGEFAAYFFSVFAMYVVFALMLYAVEMIAVRLFGFNNGNFGAVYNMAPPSVHDSVEATYSTISIAMFFAFFVPAVCVWMLRDNIDDVGTDVRRENIVNMSVTSAMGLIIIPVISILLMNGVRGDHFGSWMMNLLVSFGVSLLVFYSVFYGVDWTQQLYWFALAVLVAIDIGLDLANKGMTGLALHYAIVKEVIWNLSVLIMGCDEDAKTLQYGLFTLTLIIDSRLRKRAGKTISPVATAFGYMIVTWFVTTHKRQVPQLPAELHDVMWVASDFAALNTAMNANLDGIDDLPVGVNVIAGLLIGMAMGYATKLIKSTDEFEDTINDGQKWAEQYKETLKEEKDEMKWW